MPLEIYTEQELENGKERKEVPEFTNFRIALLLFHYLDCYNKKQDWSCGATYKFSIVSLHRSVVELAMESSVLAKYVWKNGHYETGWRECLMPGYDKPEVLYDWVVALARRFATEPAIYNQESVRKGKKEYGTI